MSDTIDRLDIAIEAQASNAIAEVDKLYASLERVANILNTASGAFGNMKTAVQGTSRALRSMAKISLPNLTTMTQQLQDLSQINLGNMGLGQNINITADSLKVLETTSDEAGKSMSALTPIVKGIETAFKGLGDIIQGVASHVGNVAKFMVSNFTLIGRAATGLGKIRGLLSGILGPLIGFYGVRSLVTLGKDAVELASDLTEVQNVVNHAFGIEGAKAVEDFVSTSKEQYGLAELAAKQYASRFQAMGKSMEITTGMVAKAHDNVRDHMVKAYQDTGDEMSAMALNLTKLTADMASFYNEDQSKVAQALQSVYTGQTRSLRQYGIDLTQVNLQEWAHKQGIEAKMDAMTQAEKAMLRYQYIMAQTSMVQGDFARTADTWANQIRLLKQNFQALGSVIGNVVINAFKPLITWLNAAMTKVIAFAETIANALGKIFGWTIRGETGGGGDAGMGELESGLDGVGDAADGAGGSLGKANDKAKELKRTLLGFDEINKLNEPTDSSSGSGGSGGSGGGSGGSGGGGGASAGDFQLVQTETIFDKFKSDFQTLFGLGKYISGVLSDAMESIDWDSAYKKARNFGSGLAEFLNGLISPRLFRNLGITIAGSINAVLNARDAFLNRFNFKNLGYSIAAGLNGFFETWDAGLSAKAFYKTINGIVDAIWAAADKTEWSFIGTKISSCVRDAVKGIEWESKVYPAASKFGEGLADFMNGLFKPSTFSALGDTVAKYLNTALRTLSAWANKFNWSSFGTSLAASLRRFISSFNWNLAANTFNTLAKGVLEAAGKAIGGVNWLSFGLKIRNAIMLIDFDKILLGVGTVIMKAINAALDFAKGLFDGTPVEEALETIQSIVNGVAANINFDNLKTGLQGILDVGLQFGAGFMEGFTGAMGALADIGVGVLTGIGFAIGVIAEALKKLDPDFVKHLGEAFGIMAAAFVGMKLATGVATTISGIVGALGGAGAAAATTATEVAATGAAASGSALTFGSFAKALFTSTGFMEGGLIGATVIAAQKLQEMEDKARGGNGVLSEMGGIMGEIGNTFSPQMKNEIFKLTNELENNSATTEEAAEAFAEYFNGKQIDPSKIKNAMIGIRGDMNTTAEQESLVTQILEQMGTKAKSTFGDMESGSSKMSGAFDEIGKKAEGADEKTGGFSTGMAGFVGGILAQTVTMALMGTAYKNIGDKAETAQSPIEGLKSKITDMVTSISTNSATAQTESKTLSDNVVDTFVDTIENASHIVPNAAQTGLIDPLTGTVKSGLGINSPSTVMAGFGTNVDQGFANGISGSASLVTTEMSKLVDSTLQKVKDKYNDFNTAGSTLAEKLSKGLGSVSMPDLGSQIGISSTYSAHNESNPIYKAGKSIANAFKAGLSSVTATLDYRQIVGKVIKVGGKSEGVERWQSYWYASGGFPNYGEVFVANERGPEMIGKFGNKNVVANNAQITEGIKSAVVEGMMKAAMSGVFGNNDGTPVVLNAVIKTPDGDVLARVVEKAQARRDARYRLTTVG